MKLKIPLIGLFLIILLVIISIFVLSANSKKTIDELYKIDTKTGIKKRIAITSEDFNMSDLAVSKDESQLYFVDGNSGNIHQVLLK